MPPFTREQFFEVFAAYNGDTWPAALVAYSLALAALAAWLRIVPLLWALIGGSASLLLSVPQDAALPVAAIAALLVRSGHLRMGASCHA